MANMVNSIGGYNSQSVNQNQKNEVSFFDEQKLATIQKAQ